RLDGARGRGEVWRLGPASHVGAAGSVHRDPEALVQAAAAEKGGVDQGRAGGVELHHEGIEDAAEGLPDGARGRGEVRREGEARDVGIAGGINCYGVPTVGRESAEVGGVDQRRAVSVEFRHEGVSTAGKGGWESAGGRREE